MMHTMNQQMQSGGKVQYGGRWRTPEQVEKVKAAARKASKESRANKAERLAAHGQKFAGFRERIEWVIEHLGRKHCPTGVDKATRVIWALAKKDPQSFMDQYLPLLVRKETGVEAERDIEAERQDREGRKLIDEWLKRRRVKPCPTCQGKGWRDADFQLPDEDKPIRFESMPNYSMPNARC
jgi:hypothetical protein